ncbi:hypothetical protein BDV39DRAFT_175633 [Aspergillus sergii]|uniref:CENP-V/GFA domain-containing protein n=1 Tax=Aspergillus sergii TaxID=1034303 RepID=A0A5N6X7A0_9EURO|nr:hypothetical protein BDV39DRAFT_175633 [Aspergillus sergii]
MTSISTGNCLCGACAYSYASEPALKVSLYLYPSPLQGLSSSNISRPSAIAIFTAKFQAGRIRSTLRSQTEILQRINISVDSWTIS